jgi:hypothetical protein
MVMSLMSVMSMPFMSRFHVSWLIMVYHDLSWFMVASSRVFIALELTRESRRNQASPFNSLSRSMDTKQAMYEA